MNIFLLWYLCGLIGWSIVNYYETKEINKTLKKAWQEGGRLDTCYIGGIPTFWQGLLISLLGLIPLLIAVHEVHREYKIQREIGE